MLKVYMARPVPDGYHGEQKDKARTIQWLLVRGTLDELIPRINEVGWFNSYTPKGVKVMINTRHIAWIEEVDASQSNTRPS